MRTTSRKPAALSAATASYDCGKMRSFAESFSPVMTRTGGPPLDPVNVLNVGVALQALGRFDEAASQFREAIRLAPEDPDAYMKLGALHCDVFGEFEEAEEAFKVAVRLAPNDVHARYCLGNAYSRQGRAEEAIAEFRAALKIKTDAVDPLMNLGAVLCDALGRYEEAVALMNGKDVGEMTLSYATGALSRYRKALAEKSGGG